MVNEGAVSSGNIGLQLGVGFWRNWVSVTCLTKLDVWELDNGVYFVVLVMFCNKRSLYKLKWF